MTGMDHDADQSLDQDAMLELLQRARRAIDAGLTSDAEEATGELFSKVEQWAAENPSADWADRTEAAQCEMLGDWNGAEAAYQRILELAIRETSACSLFKAHQDLAGVYFVVGRLSQALEHSRLATSAARKSDLPILLLMALRSEAAHLMHFNRFEHLAGSFA
jgi:tetratricopeptide (TPR) repeat protein